MADPAPLIPDDIFDPSIKLPAGKPQAPPPEPTPAPRLTARKVQKNLRHVGGELFRLIGRYEVTRTTADRADRTAARAESLGKLGCDLTASLRTVLTAEDRREARIRHALSMALLDCIESLFETVSDLRQRVCDLEAVTGLPVGARPPAPVEERAEQEGGS